ncbi:MAG: DUF3048 domain-containing protein [Bacillota bacterium]|nr:DUF3048 domain-containing protein [Bacillota bacterium]
MKRTVYLLLLLLSAMLLLLGACAAAEEPSPELAEYVEPEPVIVAYNPLTNVGMDREVQARLLCVSIDNNPEARMHSGISKADLLYELPAEGGIPRIVAVFYSQPADMIGPVRSSRPYIIDVARGLDGLFVHCGWSEDARLYLQSGVVDYLNELTYSDYFWRDSRRDMPHNLYTSTSDIYNYLQSYELRRVQEVRPLVFREDGEPLGGVETGTDIYVTYDYADNYYQYIPEEGLYYRYIDGEPHMDIAYNKQIAVANIIIQKVSSTVLDSEGRLHIDMTAGGEAILLSGGQMLEGSWSRADLDSETIFTDSEGNEFALATGLTFIQICDQHVEIDVPLIDGAAAE